VFFSAHFSPMGKHMAAGNSSFSFYPDTGTQIRLYILACKYTEAIA